MTPAAGLSGRSTLTSWFSKSHQVLDDADGDTELTLVPRRGNAGSPTRDGSGLAVEHVETFPSPSFVKPQRFVVPRRLLAFGTFWLGTLQIAALCSAMLVVLALHGFPFDRAFRGQRFDNWGKQIFMCRGSDGPPDPADFVNIDGARFQVPANLTDKAAPTWKDAFRDGPCRIPHSPHRPLTALLRWAPGYIFWSPSTSVTGDASAVGDCTFPAKNYRGERDKMTSACRTVTVFGVPHSPPCSLARPLSSSSSSSFFPSPRRVVAPRQVRPARAGDVRLLHRGAGRALRVVLPRADGRGLL